MTFLAVALFLFSRVAGAALSVQGMAGFAVLSGAGTALYGLAALAITRAISPVESAPAYSLFWRVLVEAVLTGALSPLVLIAMRRLEGLYVREEQGLLR
jgi:rod shape-determining protein MreD